MTPQNPITIKDIYVARKRIAGIAMRTPLVFSEPLSQLAGNPVYLKLENLQPTGAFKIRGAANALLALSPQQKAQGVIAFSTGNHGRGVAHVARQLGIRAVICLSERVPHYRVQAMQQLGAEVVQHGKTQDEAYAHALDLEKEQGLTMVNPFDDPMVIAGQGTIGLEIMEDLPDIDAAVVPVSGGGLMSGIALALKTLVPDIDMIGVSMDRGPAMYHSLEAGRPVDVEEEDSLADALLGGIGLDNRYTFKLIRDHVDRMLLVSEAQIAEAMAYCLMEQRLVVEGAGAVGIAALLADKIDTPQSKTVFVLSGGNPDTTVLANLVSAKSAQGTSKPGRK